MKKIGITGSQGSGKTFILNKFASIGVPILIMDKVVRDLQLKDDKLILEIKNRFPEAYLNDNTLNKDYLIKELFYDESGKNLKDMSNIIMPYVNSEIDKFYKVNKNSKYVIVESALIYEYNLEDMFDEIIYVKSDKNLRKEMAIKRDNITSEEYDLRMKSQIPDEVKIEKSRYIITNDYTENVIEQVVELDLNII